MDHTASNLGFANFDASRISAQRANATVASIEKILTAEKFDTAAITALADRHVAPTAINSLAGVVDLSVALIRILFNQFHTRHIRLTRLAQECGALVERPDHCDTSEDGIRALKSPAAALALCLNGTPSLPWPALNRRERVS